MSEVEDKALGVLPHELLDAVNKIHTFCKERVAGCHNCPLFAGIPGEDTGCIYQGFIPAEISAQKIIDMNYKSALPEQPEGHDKLPPIGSTVVFGSRKFVVLDYIEDGAVLIQHNSESWKEFGDDADYESSSIREYLNSEYYNAIKDSIGADNIIKHRVCLEGEDGSGEEYFVEDNVSLITLHNARKYEKYIPKQDCWYWTATRKTWRFDGYEDTVCVIKGSGVFGSEDSYEDNGGVYPFFVVKSSRLKLNDV